VLDREEDVASVGGSLQLLQWSNESWERVAAPAVACPRCGEDDTRYC